MQYINYYFRRAEASTARAAAKRASWGPPRIASFLLGLPPKPPHPLKKALRNYHQRLNRHHIQFIEVNDFFETFLASYNNGPKISNT